MGIAFKAEESVAKHFIAVSTKAPEVSQFGIDVRVPAPVGGNRAQHENRRGLVPVQEELILIAEKLQDVC